MRTPRFILPRGSTPTLELRLPFALAEEDTVYLTISQQGTPVLEYARNGTAQPAAAGSLRLSEDEADLLLAEMTQADTAALQEGDCELQLRVKTALGADTFPVLRGFVGRMRKQGVI